MDALPNSAENENTWVDSRVVLLDEAAVQHWLAQMPDRQWFRCVPGDWQAAQGWLANELISPTTRKECAEWAGSKLGLDLMTAANISAPLRFVYASRLMTEASIGMDHCPARLCTEVLGWASPSHWELIDQWRAMASIRSFECMPVIVLQPVSPDQRVANHDLECALIEGDHFANTGTPIGLKLPPEEWRRFIVSHAWSRAATRWRMAPVLRGEPRLSLDHDPAHHKTEAWLRQQAPSTLPLFGIARSALTADTGENKTHPNARSAVEAFLFAVLEARSLTRNRFRLNATLDFTFGPCRAEADLAALDARLVVEIDGYYHFREPDAYRRDRRKDEALQENRWFVMRFLAEDVVGDLQTVIERIDQTLARRDVARIPNSKIQ